MNRLPVFRDDDTIEEDSWEAQLQKAAGRLSVEAVVSIQPVTAIVVSQDCDVVRAPDITLCEIDRFRFVERRAAQTNRPKSWVQILTQHARVNQKWFYLPPHEKLGFGDKMAVDFQRTIRIAREDLERMRESFRIGRLNDYARAHFRERLAEFFRRYPYDEWYALNAEELQAYRNSKPEPIQPYPWQLG